MSPQLEMDQVSRYFQVRQNIYEYKLLTNSQYGNLDAATRARLLFTIVTAMAKDTPELAMFANVYTTDSKEID